MGDELRIVDLEARLDDLLVFFLQRIGDDFSWAIELNPTLSEFRPRQFFDLEGFGAVADLGEVVIRLQAQPKIGVAVYRQFKAHGHFRRDAALSADDAIKLLPRHAARLGGLGNGQP
jgi:hypothetical protein